MTRRLLLLLLCSIGALALGIASAAIATADIVRGDDAGIVPPGEPVLLGVDDANIYMAYGRNLAAGHGLVYYAGGERVEGFTSVAWMLVTAGAYRLAPERPERFLFLVSVALVAAAWLVLIQFAVGASATRGRSPLLALGIVCAWCSSSPAYGTWMTTSLMETALWSAVLCSGTVVFARLAESDAPAAGWRAAAVSVIAVLVRPEAYWIVPVWMATAASAVWSMQRNLLRAARALGPSTVAFMATLAALTAFRLAYFGYPLPNTFYAKVSSDHAYNAIQGLRYLRDFLQRGREEGLTANLISILGSVIAGVRSRVAFDLVLIGSSFASTFFLHRYLERAGPSVRVLVLERGAMRDHRWHMTHRAELTSEAEASYDGRRSTKPWVFRLAFGGSSNCWWACTPRFLPEDFRLRSTYGVGQDWPVSYDELEDYYCEAEQIMAVSGPADGSPYPRSRPYPQPPHRFSDPARLFKQRFPDAFFNQPAARPSRLLASGRPRCCGNGVCSRCPIDSKFTILNSLAHLYDDPRVTLRTGALVTSLDVANDRVAGVRYQHDGREAVALGDLVGLGANALFNPFLLLRSGVSDGNVGQGLAEQVSRDVIVDLRGVDNFGGSTSITGLGYMLYSGEHRRERAAALMESWNVPLLRDERGRWRQRIKLTFIYEDLPQPENRVTAASDRPEVHYTAPSLYARRGLEALASSVAPVLDALPVEGYRIVEPEAPDSEGHNLSTTRMGDDPATSVVDRDLLHHRLRNLVVLGGSVFPTISPANPTLTICALSLRAADRLMAPSSAGRR